MDLSADRSTPTSAAPVQPTLREAVRAPRRRRPTGEPPPLPYHLQTSGVGWLIAAGVLVVLSIVVFRGGLWGPAIAVTVVDDAVVGWLAGRQLPGFVGIMRGLATLSSWWVLNGLALGLLLTLLVLRRLRQLIVSFTLAYLVITTATVAGASIRRPRPFGVMIQASWGGWALPSQQVTFLAALLVGILYTLVPEDRWRNTGKWVAAVLIALTAVGRMALGADAPTDVLVAVAIGVTLPLVAFRMVTPSKVFPITYRRGRSAHLDVTGARGKAIQRGLEHQLGLIVQDIKPFGLSGSAGSTPLRITVKGADGEQPTQLFGKLYAQATCAPTAPTSSAASCSTAGWRTRSPSTPSAGWSSRRTTPCGCAATPAYPPPDPTAWSSSPPNANTYWSPSSSRAPPSSARPRSTSR